jgi:hypothetical protein
MRVATLRPLLLVGGMLVMPSHAPRADDASGTSLRGTAVSVSSSASATASSASSAGGCRAEASASATTRAGDEVHNSTDHKQAEGPGPCRANASATAKAESARPEQPPGK